jgi:hypothetical protein
MSIPPFFSKNLVELIEHIKENKFKVIPKGGKCSNQIIELVYLMMDNV